MRIDLHPGADQSQEAFDVTYDDGRSERMRIHEYGRVYAVPGLYEAVVQDALECASPRTLAAALTAACDDPGALRVLDLGAGNGVVGEELRAHGVTEPLIGLDPEPAAGPAAQRDRPGLYGAFLTATLDEVDVGGLVAEHGLNCLAGAGALGTGHTTRAQIESAWDAFPSGAWLALTFHADVLSDAGGELRDFVLAQDAVVLERFRHRLSAAGDPITYAVLVARRA